jgi:DNA-binding NtrC family response regulator
MEPTENLKILILDDEKQFTEELSDYFQASTFETFQANTVAEGKELLKHQEVDLLFLDVRLPGASGLDILKEVRLKYPGMLVVIVSAHVDMEIVNQAIREGAFDYLRKPFRYIDIQIAVERVQKYIGMHRKLLEMEEQLNNLKKEIQSRT